MHCKITDKDEITKELRMHPEENRAEAKNEATPPWLFSPLANIVERVDEEKRVHGTDTQETLTLPLRITITGNALW